MIRFQGKQMKADATKSDGSPDTLGKGLQFPLHQIISAAIYHHFFSFVV